MSLNRSTKVRTVQDLINVWFAHRNIEYPLLALDGIKGKGTDVAIERIKKCFGWTGKNVNPEIDARFLSKFGLKDKDGRLVPGPREKSTPVQTARGLAYRRKLRAYLKKQDQESKKVLDAYWQANLISSKDYPYVWGGGHESAGHPSGGGYDCSGSVGAVLANAGGFGYVVGQDVPSSTAFEMWGLPGEGKYMTIWANDDHVWIQWNLKDKAWRFDTSPHGSGGNGPQQRFTPRSTDGFVPRHWENC